MNFPSPADIREAAERIRPYAHRTPVMTSAQLNRLAGCELHFKCENLQRIGAFKIRGAINAVFSLSDSEAAGGVATHSSGNHAQALALAASLRGIKATIVMPENAPAVKIAAVKGYGGNIIFCKPTHEARERTLQEFLDASGGELIHPYNDFRIITGQATAGMELIEEIGAPDAVIAPVGGGGLLSGTSLSTTYFAPDADTYGAEPALADDAYRSIRDGIIHPPLPPATIADGLLTGLGEKTFAVISQHTRRILTVEEDTIRKAMQLLMERMKLVVEPSGAVALAAVLQHPKEFSGKKVGVIISGGNLDLSQIPVLLQTS
ncbi:MAG: pyridoxal-phosphate dependent enzyme [Flavobacteriales bacterium]|nr:pyridoxal-phosphate dependent enzyme [Flavobacteriales bacterium]